jgi:hypothetical protein
MYLHSLWNCLTYIHMAYVSKLFTLHMCGRTESAIDQVGRRVTSMPGDNVAIATLSHRRVRVATALYDICRQ